MLYSIETHFTVLLYITWYILWKLSLYGLAIYTPWYILWKLSLYCLAKTFGHWTAILVWLEGACLLSYNWISDNVCGGDDKLGHDLFAVRWVCNMLALTAPLVALTKGEELHNVVDKIGMWKTQHLLILREASKILLLLQKAGYEWQGDSTCGEGEQLWCLMLKKESIFMLTNIFSDSYSYFSDYSYSLQLPFLTHTATLFLTPMATLFDYCSYSFSNYSYSKFWLLQLLFLIHAATLSPTPAAIISLTAAATLSLTTATTLCLTTAATSSLTPASTFCLTPAATLSLTPSATLCLTPAATLSDSCSYSFSYSCCSSFRLMQLLFLWLLQLFFVWLLQLLFPQLLRLFFLWLLQLLFLWLLLCYV